MVLDGGGGVTIRLLGSGGSSWAIDEDGGSGPASRVAAGGAIAVDLWNHDRSAAGRLSVEGGAYGLALEAAAILPIGGRRDGARAYGILGATVATMHGGGGLGAVLGLGLELAVSDRLSACVETRLHAVGHDESAAEPTAGAAGVSALAGIAFTF